MKLIPGKKYQVRFNQKEAHFAFTEAFKKFKNKSILVCYEEDKNKRMLIRYIDKNEGYFKIIDKRLESFACFKGTYFISRFIIEEQLQLELEF